MILASGFEISRVGVLFKFGTVQPKWIELNFEKIAVKEMFYSWTERKGKNLIYKFTFTDGLDIYEIAFDSFSMKWFLIAQDSI